MFWRSRYSSIPRLIRQALGSGWYALGYRTSQLEGGSPFVVDRGLRVHTDGSGSIPTRDIIRFGAQAYRGLYVGPLDLTDTPSTVGPYGFVLGLEPKRYLLKEGGSPILYEAEYP